MLKLIGILLLLVIPISINGQYPPPPRNLSVYFVDPDYSGSTRNGTRDHPWQSLSDTLTNNPWTIINNSLVKGQTTVYFSARKASSDTNQTSTTSIVAQRTGSSVLILDGHTKYNTNISNPKWIDYHGSSKFQLTGNISASTTQSNFYIKDIILISSGAQVTFGYNYTTQTISPNTCSTADVQLAVSNTALDGYTASIPSGTCTWTTAVTLTKSIAVEGVGAGTKTQCNTVSQSTYTCITGDIKYINWVIPSTGSPRLGNITFYGDTCTDCGGGAYGGAYVNLNGRNGQFRLHNVTIDVTGPYTGLIIGEYIRGVGWNNNCVQRAQISHCWLVLHQYWMNGTSPYGDKSWADASTIGTAEAWYWEDNTFTGIGFADQGYCTDDFMGARVVYRFNNLTNCSLQNHGTETGGRWRGYREVDYYRNIAVNNTSSWLGAFAYRGGNGYGWQNTFTTSGSGSYSQTIVGNTYRRDDTSHSDGWAVWNRCGIYSVTITRSGAIATVTEPGHEVHTGGSYVNITGANQSEYNGIYYGYGIDSNTWSYTISGSPATPATGTITSRSPFDGNTDTTGYRCLDGFASGTSGILISGDQPPFGNITPLTGNIPTGQPVYGWLNKLNGVQSNIVAPMDFVVANRDLFNENPIYNGTSQRGIFVGTSLPASCTVNDSAWITNQGTWNTETSLIHSNHGTNHTLGEDGKRYLCTSTNTWSARYGINLTGEPYIYPHPLRVY